MKARVWIASALALPALLVASGCGGGDETEARSLTKAQFVRLTEDFCEREYKAEERDMERYAEKHGLVFGGGKPWEQERLNEAIVFDYVRDKIAYFKSLPAPEGDEKEVQAMIRAFERGLIASELIPESLAEPRPGQRPLPNPFDASYRTTTDYGPWLCGQP
ncbi:MAG TPA: hypothetical protein VFT79_00685 [Solirubrobacterales bacterium]|nr:hypothetical protein [Solirubrobacterales bacterium]